MAVRVSTRSRRSASGRGADKKEKEAVAVKEGSSGDDENEVRMQSLGVMCAWVGREGKRERERERMRTRWKKRERGTVLCVKGWGMGRRGGVEKMTMHASAPRER